MNNGGETVLSRACYLVVLATFFALGCNSRTSGHDAGAETGITADIPRSTGTSNLAVQGDSVGVAPTRPNGAGQSGTLSLTGTALNEFLAAAAKRQSLVNAANSEYDWRADLFTNQSRLIMLRENGMDYRVAIQTGCEWCIPCVGQQQIVLLSPSGEILDRIQCQMTIKLGTGGMTTEVYQRAQPDGARIVVRYVGSPGKMPGGGDIPAWLHEMHDIVFRGSDHGFGADDRFLRTGGPAEPNIWARSGLCRLRIANGKLNVLFPALEDPGDKLRSAVSLRVKYHDYPWDVDWKTEVFDNRAEVKELVSSISIQRTLQITSGTSAASNLAASISVPQPQQPVGDIGDHVSNAVQLCMPDGRAMTVAFHKDPTCLTLYGWGLVELGSKDFYDKLSVRVAKRLGKPVELANGYN